MIRSLIILMKNDSTLTWSSFLFLFLLILRFFAKKYTLFFFFNKSVVFLFLFWYIVEFFYIFDMLFCIIFIVFLFVIVASIDIWFLDFLKRFDFLSKFAKKGVAFVMFKTLAFKINCVINNNFIQFDWMLLI